MAAPSLVLFCSLAMRIEVVGNRHGVVAALGEQDHEIGELEGLDGAEQQRQHQQAADIGEGDGPETAASSDTRSMAAAS